MPVLVSTAVLVIVRNRVGHGLGVPLKTGATVLFILSAASAVDSLFSEKKSRQKTFVKKLQRFFPEGTVSGARQLCSLQIS